MRDFSIRIRNALLVAQLAEWFSAETDNLYMIRAWVRIQHGMKEK